MERNLTLVLGGIIVNKRFSVVYFYYARHTGLYNLALYIPEYQDSIRVGISNLNRL